MWIGAGADTSEQPHSCISAVTHESEYTKMKTSPLLRERTHVDRRAEGCTGKMTASAGCGKAIKLPLDGNC